MLHLNSALVALLAATGERILAIDAEQALLRAGRECVAPDARLVAASGGSASQGMVAVIPVQGTLSARGYGVPMDRLRNSIRGAVNNPDVSAIVLDMDTPGGTVAGTPETAAAIREAAQQKKIIAVSNTLSASAGYWLGAQASEFVVSPSADVGSIGVFAMHLDVSKALESLGVSPTMIVSSGSPYKVEGNPFAPLSDEARAYQQARVDESYDQFVRDVAQGRGTSLTNVRENFGQGRVMGADKAVALGMADRVATIGDVIAGLSGKRPSARRSALAFF